MPFVVETKGYPEANVAFRILRGVHMSGEQSGGFQGPADRQVPNVVLIGRLLPAVHLIVFRSTRSQYASHGYSAYQDEGISYTDGLDALS